MGIIGGTRSGRQLGVVGLSGKQLGENRESTSGTDAVTVKRPCLQDKHCGQLGGKWGTTAERSERQLGNNGATTNGRHVEIIGSPILGNKSDMPKASTAIGGQF